MRRLICLTLTAGLLTGTTLAQTLTGPQVARRGNELSTLKVLNQRLPEVAFRETPFEQVMDFITDLTKLNLVVRWQNIVDAGVPKDKPVSLQAKNLRLSQVLWLVMSEAGGSDVKLAYRASGNLLVLSTEEDLNKEMVTKVYDVSDLLVRIRNSSREGAFDLTQNMNNVGSQGGGGGTGLFGNSNQQNQYGNDNRDQYGAGAAQTPEMQQLVELIQQTVEPDTWTVNGGLGTVHSFRGGLLVIRNTLLVHQRLGGYVREGEAAGP